MSRVQIQFDGSARGALAAARQVEGGLDRVSRSAGTADRRLDGVGSSMGRVSKIALGAVGAAGGITLFFQGLRSSLDAVVESESSLQRMQTQLKALDISYAGHARQIETVIQKHSQLAALDDEELQDSFTALVRVTKDVNEALRLNGIVADVARGRQISVEAATQLVIKAQMGQLGALRRAGIELPKVTAAQDALKGSLVKASAEQIAAAKAADNLATRQGALAALQKTYAGQASAYGASNASALDHWHVALENFQEAIGRGILPTFSQYLGQASKWLSNSENQERAQHKVQAAVETFVDVVRAGTPIVKEIAGAVQTVVDAVGGLENALKLLLAATVFSKLSKLSGAFVGLGGAKGIGAANTALGTSGGKTGLLGGLGALGKIGRIAIPVAIAVSVMDKDGNPLEKAEQGGLLGLLFGGLKGAGIGAAVGLSWALGQKAGETVFGPPGTTPTTTAPKPLDIGAMGSPSGIAKVARSQKGVKYSWGGGSSTGPSLGTEQGADIFGFDCSSFAQYVMAKNGITIPRRTYEQWKAGRDVTGGALQTGDLVFFHMGPQGPEHVGIYLGNDVFIHAPHTGTVIHEQQFSGYEGYVGARRFIPDYDTTPAPKPDDKDGMPAKVGDKRTRGGVTFTYAGGGNWAIPQSAGGGFADWQTIKEDFPAKKGDTKPDVTADPQVAEDKLLAGRINEFFKAGAKKTGKRSVLANAGNIFIRAGRKYGLDPAFLAAVAAQESAFGTSLYRKNNVMGWGGIDFDSIEECIFTAAAGIRKGYADMGRTTVEAWAAKYSPPGADNDPNNTNWTEPGNVSANLRALGGDPNTITGPYGSGDPYKPPKAAPSPLISVALQTQLAKAQLTGTLVDDLRALKAERASLQAKLKGSKGEKRLEILQALKGLADEIDGVEQEAADRIQAAADAIAPGFQAAVNRLNRQETRKLRGLVRAAVQAGPRGDDYFRRDADPARVRATSAAFGRQLAREEAQRRLEQRRARDFSAMAVGALRDLADPTGAKAAETILPLGEIKKRIAALRLIYREGAKAAKEAAARELRRLVEEELPRAISAFNALKQARADGLADAGDLLKKLRAPFEQPAKLIPLDELKTRIERLREILRTGSAKAVAAARAELAKLAPSVDAAVAAAQAAVQAKQTAFSNAFQRLAGRIMTAFDRETERHLEGMRAELDDQVRAIRETADELTPGETALSEFEASRRATERARRLAEIQNRIAAATTPEERAAAERDLQDLLLDEQEDGLRKRAEAERAARNREADEQIAALQKAFEARQRDYQDQRDAQRQALEDELADWLVKLGEKKASWEDFIKWLQGKGASGIFGAGGLPDPVQAMLDAGASQGGAFADAFIDELRRAYAAWQAVMAAIAAGDPSKDPFASNPGTPPHGRRALEEPFAGDTMVPRSATIMGQQARSQRAVARASQRAYDTATGTGGPVIVFQGSTFYGATERQAKRALGEAVTPHISRTASYPSPL